MTKPPLSISSDNTLHTMIVTILILECACRFHASSSRPSCNEALHMAYSRYRTSGTHHAVRELFPSCREYSISQIKEFVLRHRL